MPSFGLGSQRSSMSDPKRLSDGAGLESLEDFKRKLDNEHETISSKLSQGLQHRHELSALKTKLVEDLELTRQALEKKQEQVEAKISALTRLRKKKEEQVEYFLDQQEDAQATLRASQQAQARLDDFLSKLDFEFEEIERKLESESERTDKLKEDKKRLEAQVIESKNRFDDALATLKGRIGAEEEIAAGLKDFSDHLSTELEYTKRKFVIESKFKSKQESNQKKLETELSALNEKMRSEESVMAELTEHKEQLNQFLRDATEKLNAELSLVTIQHDTERKLVDKMANYLTSLSEQHEFVKGSLVAAADIRSHLEAYLSNVTSKEGDAQNNLKKSEEDESELQKLKLTFETEYKEVGEVFQVEIEDASCRRQTAEKMVTHLRKYLHKLDLEVQIVTEKLEVETFGRLELDELRDRLEVERANVKSRVDEEARAELALVAHKKSLEEERESKLLSLQSDIDGVEDRLRAEQARVHEWRKAVREVSGERELLEEKIKKNDESAVNLDLRRRRVQEVMHDVQTQAEQVQESVEGLSQERERLNGEIANVTKKIDTELEEIEFRIGVESKALSGLKSFERKLTSDLDFIKRKLKTIDGTSVDLQEQMRRLGEVLTGINFKIDSQRRTIDQLEGERREAEAQRDAQLSSEDADREKITSQLESDTKMMLGVDDYKRKLAGEIEGVKRNINTEKTRQKAISAYDAQVSGEIEVLRGEVEALSAAFVELQDERRGVVDEMQEIKLKYAGDLDDVADRMEVDMRASAGLEGYRRNLGDELDVVRKKLDARRSLDLR